MFCDSIPLPLTSRIFYIPVSYQEMSPLFSAYEMSWRADKVAEQKESEVCGLSLEHQVNKEGDRL